METDFEDEKKWEGCKLKRRSSLANEMFSCSQGTNKSRKLHEVSINGVKDNTFPKGTPSIRVPLNPGAVHNIAVARSCQKEAWSSKRVRRLFPW